MIIYTHQRSKKRKPTSKERQLAADWESLKIKYATKTVVADKKSDNYVPTKSYVRETRHYPSLPPTGPMACTKPLKEVRYTGDKIIGIGTLHKSNAVPIFSEEEAKDQATMRR
jgi:hypothetical protein